MFDFCEVMTLHLDALDRLIWLCGQYEPDSVETFINTRNRQSKPTARPSGESIARLAGALDPLIYYFAAPESGYVENIPPGTFRLNGK